MKSKSAGGIAHLSISYLQGQDDDKTFQKSYGLQGWLISDSCYRGTWVYSDAALAAHVQELGLENGWTTSSGRVEEKRNK